MVLILIGILSVISITSYIDGESDRKGLKLMLSITLSIMLSYIIEVTKQSLLAAGILKEYLLIFIFYFTYNLFYNISGSPL